jgi:hypothetical protein
MARFRMFESVLIFSLVVTDVRAHGTPHKVVPLHTHPTDENIVVVQGSWSVGMGTRITLSAVQSLELGARAHHDRSCGTTRPVASPSRSGTR